MLGLERVPTESPPRTASGTELRRHQVDALAGMLAELIATTQRSAEENGNGGGNGAAEPEVDDEADDDFDAGFVEEGAAEAGFHGADPGAVRRYRFRHPTASGKTIAAAGFVEAPRARRPDPHAPPTARIPVQARPHDRGLRRPLRGRGGQGTHAPRENPITIQTYAWFARHGSELDRDTYDLVLCDEAHTALGEKTSAAIRAFHEPLYIGMTATEQLIAKQVSDVFPASVDDLPLADAARRGLIAPLRNLCRRRPRSTPSRSSAATSRSALAAALDHEALNQAAASLYRERFGVTPGIVYAAGVEHAYNLAQEFRAAGLKAEAVSGKTLRRDSQRRSPRTSAARSTS